MIKFISSRSGPAGAGGEFLPLPPTGVDSVAYASLNARATTRRQVDMLLRSSPLQLDAGSGGAEVDTTAASFAVPMLVTYQRRLVRLAYDCYSDSWGPCVALADYSHAFVARWCGAVQESGCRFHSVSVAVRVFCDRAASFITPPRCLRPPTPRLWARQRRLSHWRMPYARVWPARCYWS